MYRLVRSWINSGKVPFPRVSFPDTVHTYCSVTAARLHTSPRSHSHATPIPLPAHRPHVIVIGGGSLGLFHASLFQLRFQYEQNQINGMASANPDPSCSIQVISAQPSLLHHLSNTGVQLELLAEFVRAQQSWIPTGLSEAELETAIRKSHFTLPLPVKIPAAASISLTHGLNTVPTHVLIIVKGAAAVKRAASDLYRVLVELHELKHPLPAICILMNGLGHVELIVEQWKELLQSDDKRYSPSSQDKLLDLFQSRIFTATTTNGAKVEKIFAESNSSSSVPLIELRVKHGGMGSTTVLQNAWEENAEKQTEKNEAQRGEFPHARYQVGSSSLVTLFQSIGFETHLAPHAAAQSVLYTKLLVNCVINPLTALHYVNNGKIRSPEFTEWVVHLAQECVAVINRLGISISDYPSNREGESQMYPENLAEYMPADADEDLKRALFHVYMTAHRTFHNYSSMVNDLHSSQGVNRPRTTEIDNITGFLLNKAQHLGFKPEQFPYNHEVYNCVKQAEKLFATEPQRSRISSLPTTKLK